MRLSDFTEINPYEKLPKGTIAKKISMEQLEPYKKFVSGYSLEAYSGGAKFRNGDTIMARITPCLENGKTAFVSTLEKNEVGFGSTEYIVFRAKDGISHPDFVYYLVISSLVREPAIKSMVGSSGRQRVQQTVIDELEIPNYSLAEQQHIVDILGSIDAKIENNEKIISNVLKLYRLKFRNLAMKYEQKTVLSYIASVESGKRPLHKSAALDGSFNIPIIGASSIMGYTDDYLFNEPILVIGRVGTLGVVQSIFGKSYPSDNALIIRSKYYTFCYCALNELDYNSLNKGSTQPLITQTDIKNIQIPLIPQSEMQQFEMHNKIDIIVALKEENNMLRELKALYLKKFFE